MEFLKAEDAITLRISNSTTAAQPRCRLSVNLFYTVLDVEDGDKQNRDCS
jgi:hypothetical protein